MLLASLSLENIRKHSKTKIDFAKKLNYIVGGNGVGKTTILESVYYLCTTKSCVTSADSEVVKMGENGFGIQGEFSGITSDSVRVNYSLTENKKAYIIGNKPVNKFSEVIGKYPVVLLSPSDHAITQGYPAERRKFVDSVISQSSRTYLNILIEYNRILRQRSSHLIRLREKAYVDLLELDSWNERLILSGSEIIKRRDEFINEFRTYINESYGKILSEKEQPGIEYSFLDDGEQSSIENKFRKQLELKYDDEIRRGKNLVGPHRDDFNFSINKKNLKNYGSQGQHKTFQTVLRFSEYFYLKDKTGEDPIFLLDDVFGELDAERASAISNYLSCVGQAMITLTDFGNFSYLKVGKEDRIIKLSMDGKATYA